jgi:hypothetical protein
MGVLREPRWTLGRYIQGALESQTGTPERAFVEKASNEGDAVGHPSRRREFGKRVRGVRSPVAARLRYFDKAGAESQRRMASEIGDGEYFIA